MIKKTSLLLLLLLVVGCTSNLNSEEAAAPSSSGWSERVSSLGEPSYERFSVLTGFEILPFPGITYSGLREGYHAFYASNEDYTFAIYVYPYIQAGTDYDSVKDAVSYKYSSYSNLNCIDVNSDGWLTEASVFECTYYIDYIDVNYKSAIFYRDGYYIETLIGVWGTTLGSYEYIFDEFNQKAVKWT